MKKNALKFTFAVWAALASTAAYGQTTTFSYTASEKEEKFDVVAKFIGATALQSHDFVAGAGTVVYEGVVTSIASDAFRAIGSSNTNLISITIPASVKSLASSAFRRSTALTTINFDGTPTLQTIETSAFEGCSALTAFAVPASVEIISDNAFNGCSELASFTFTGTSVLDSIGRSPFYNCPKITAITLPESLTKTGADVFNGTNITSLVVPKNLINIGEGLTYACPITSLSVAPENPKYDSRGNCNAVIETATNKLVAGCCTTVIPNNVTTIGTFAFAQFSGTFSLPIPESVTAFEFGAIHMCTGLTFISIPSGITEIDMMTFGGCISVTDVYCYANPAALTWEGSDMAFADSKATRFHVKSTDLAAWQTNFPDANVTFLGDLETVTPVDHLTTEPVSERWFTVDGRCIHTEPSAKGIYIHNGKKIIK